MLFSEAVRPPILAKTHPPGWWNRSTSGYRIHHLHQPHATSEKYFHDIVKLRPSKMNNNFAPENGWLGNDPFILGRFIFRCEVLSSARAIFLFILFYFFFDNLAPVVSINITKNEIICNKIHISLGYRWGSHSPLPIRLISMTYQFHLSQEEVLENVEDLAERLGFWVLFLVGWLKFTALEVQRPWTKNY